MCVCVYLCVSVCNMCVYICVCVCVSVCVCVLTVFLKYLCIMLLQCDTKTNGTSKSSAAIQPLLCC